MVGLVGDWCGIPDEDEIEAHNVKVVFCDNIK